MVTISITDSVGCRSTDEAMILMVTISITDSVGCKSTDDAITGFHHSRVFRQHVSPVVR